MSASRTQPNSAWLAAMPGLWAMFTVGIVSAIISPSLPVLVEMYDLNWAEAGQTFSALIGGRLLAAFLLGLREWRRATGMVVAVGGLALSGGLFCAALSPGWPATLAAIAATGFGFGLVETGYSARFAIVYGGGNGGATQSAAWLNTLHALFGAGALAGPLLVDALAYERPWWGAFTVAALFALIIPATLLPRRQTAEIAPAGDNAQQRAGIVVFLAILVCLVCGGLETALGAWIYTFLTEGALIAGETAAASVTAYWVLLVIGRLVSARGVARAGVMRWTLWLGLVLCGSLGAGLALNAYGTPAIVMVLAGLGLSGVFPAIIGWVAGASAPVSARVVAWLFAANALGAIAVPWLVDVAAYGQSLVVSQAILLLAGLLMLAAIYYLLRRESAAETESIAH